MKTDKKETATTETVTTATDEITLHIRALQEKEASLFREKMTLEGDVMKLKRELEDMRRDKEEQQRIHAQLLETNRLVQGQIRDCDLELKQLDVMLEERQQKLEDIKVQTAVARALQKTEVEHLERDKRLEELIEHYVHLSQEDFAYRFITSLGCKRIRDAEGNVVGKKPIIDIYLESARREADRLYNDSKVYVRRGGGNMADYTDLEKWKRPVSSRPLPTVAAELEADKTADASTELEISG